MQFVFDEPKATEAASHVLSLSGGSMSYLRLIKLMYLADRRCLVETGFSITGDRMVSMPHGPVLSAVLNRIKDAREGIATVWREAVSPPSAYQVRLLEPPPRTGRLSRYEIRVLRETCDKYKPLSDWRLRDLTHRLPEYHDPKGSMLPIDPKEILRSEGKSGKDIAWRVALAESFVEIDHRHKQLGV